MVSLFMPAFEIRQNEQNVPADGGGRSYSARGAQDCSSQDKEHLSDEQQQVITVNWSHWMKFEVTTKKKEKTQTKPKPNNSTTILLTAFQPQGVNKLMNA